ncbi:MAG: shikimate kinase, partial [Clostridia bacterium]|nr:shikimate kinase [Clostridia bacterium]
MNIILAGMPASGKTTVSKELGKILGCKVVDTDALIVEKYGEINGIFQAFGEEYFRDKETETVKEVCTLENAVISLGGGCLLRQKNVELLKNSGKIIYLKTTLETLIERAKGDTSRPLLKL